MTDDTAVHDVLERAVREHQPSAVDPTGAVLELARTDRRRAVLAGLAVALVCVLGAGGLLGLQAQRSAGTDPASPGGDRTALWTAGQPDDALGREEAAAREAAEAAALARAAADLDQFRVTYTELPLVTTPAGWSRFTVQDGESDPEDVECSDSPRVIYQITVGGQPGTDRPCVGVPVEPYLWNGSGVLPSMDTPVDQVVLPDGSPRWVQTDEAARQVDVYFPQSGQFVRAVGVDLDELLPFLTPGGATVGTPLVPEAADGESARVSRDGGTAFGVTEEEYADLSTVLRQQAAVPTGSRGSCFGTEAAHWEIQVLTDGKPSGFLVVDAVAETCGIAASTFGGVAQADQALLSMLAQLAGG